MGLYKIKRIENKGRCLAADAHIRAGDAVLACEPYEATLDDAEVSKRSHLTFRSLQRPLRCGQCKFARFHPSIPNLFESRRNKTGPCQCHAPSCTLNNTETMIIKATSYGPLEAGMPIEMNSGKHGSRATRKSAKHCSVSRRVFQAQLSG